MTTAPRPSVESLSRADQDAFVAALGGIFEHSPWVAERAWEARPFASVEALHRAMVGVVERLPRETQVALVRAHPELAGREAAAGTLTADSTGEQQSAGLDRCTPDELARLRDLNARYREKFGFPFVMAVRGRSRHEIMDAMEARLGNDAGTELARCLSEIGRITRVRLDALFGE
jgi:2-oxo-4-hydroxy-4-carboxy-5-ureidoimidazoline decarboxylase